MSRDRQPKLNDHEIRDAPCRARQGPAMVHEVSEEEPIYCGKGQGSCDVNITQPMG